jgi:hypothetical protein
MFIISVDYNSSSFEYVHFTDLSVGMDVVLLSFGDSCVGVSDGGRNSSNYVVLGGGMLQVQCSWLMYVAPALT